MQIKTFLPIFSGFYNTIFEPNEGNFLYENNCQYNDIEVDYKTYENDIAKECCNFVAENCPFIKDIIFENVVSPKEYNFRNDSINCTIDIDVKELVKYLYANIEALEEYLAQKYTSCSGFISSYGNTFYEWVEDTDNFKNLEGHYLGALLDFYFENESIDTEQMYYYATEDILIDCYITIQETTFDNLPYERKIEVLKELIETNEIDFTFGYNKVIFDECQNKANLLGADIYELLIEYKGIVNNINKFAIN